MSRNLQKPTRYEGLTLTPRDRLIIRAVYRYRFLNTDQIMLLTGSKSRSKMIQRIRQLWGNDFLDRPECQRELFAYADKRPTIHALGKEGAKWLTENDQIYFPKAVDWRAKNKNIKSGDFILHTMGVTETMLQVEKEIGGDDSLRLIDKDELWLCSPNYNPHSTKAFELPTKLSWANGETVKRSTKPDYPFGITISKGEEKSKGLYFLEYDRSTESFAKSSATQSSILQKLIANADVHNRKLHQQKYGYKNFRVLFVIEGNQRRIENMIAVYQAHVADSIPAGAFLFTTVESLKTKGFMAPIWLNGKQEAVSLFQTKSTLNLLTPSSHLRHPV